jgi:hypothetical protein
MTVFLCFVSWLIFSDINKQMCGVYAVCTAKWGEK